MSGAVVLASVKSDRSQPCDGCQTSSTALKVFPTRKSTGAEAEQNSSIWCWGNEEQERKQYHAHRSVLRE
jgi:hypothetical protein